jgi:hypothetical protein
MESTVLGTPLTLSTVDTGTTPISLPQSHVALVAAKAIIALALMTLVWLIRMVMIAHGIQRILQDVEDTILQISLQAMRAVLVTVEMMEIDKMITTILTFMKIVKMILLPLIHMEMVALGTLKTRPDVELMMIQTLQLLKIAVPVAVELTMIATLVMRMRTMTTIVMMALQTKMDVLTTCLWLIPMAILAFTTVAIQVAVGTLMTMISFRQRPVVLVHLALTMKKMKTTSVKMIWQWPTTVDMDALSMISILITVEFTIATISQRVWLAVLVLEKVLKTPPVLILTLQLILMVMTAHGIQTIQEDVVITMIQTFWLQINAVLVVVAMSLIVLTPVLMITLLLTQMDSHAMLTLCSQMIVVRTMTMISPLLKLAVLVKICMIKITKLLLLFLAP